MFNLMGKKIIAILRLKSLLNWPYVINVSVSSQTFTLKAEMMHCKFVCVMLYVPVNKFSIILRHFAVFLG